MFATRRAAGPVIGVAPGCEMGDAGGVVCGAVTLPASRIPPPATSARVVGIMGRSADFPFSNSRRHSSGTEAGSRRYCSYITCTKAALWVPKTNLLTACNLNRAYRLGEGYLLGPMHFLALLLVAVQTPDPGLAARIAARVAAAPARAVGVYFRDLTTGDSVRVGADLRFHAASTMKVPVMIQLFRDRDAGQLSLDDSIPVTNTFRSIVDSSTYELTKADDSDSSLYTRVGGKASIGELVELMETVSSNLATNLLIARVGAPRANATAHALGADSILVLRGVEDGKAYRAGLNNTTTARDLGVLLAAIADGRAASPAACRDMLEILGRQHFKEGIPSGLPAGTRVYHKTGWIGGVVYHDAAVVELAGGRRYVLVVLTGGVQKDEDAYKLVSDLSRLVYEGVVQ